MRAFRGHMACKTMIERGFVDSMENSGGGANNIAIENHRDSLQSRGEDCPSYGGDFPSAQPAQELQRIGEMVFVPQGGGLHCGDFPLKGMIVNSRSIPNPIRSAAAVEPVIDRRSDRGIANSHFAEAKKLHVSRNSSHSESKAGRRFLLLEPGFLGDVLGWNIERQIKNGQP